MRKGFDGLCGLVTNQLSRSPMDGGVYIFINKQRNQIKLLCWEPGGLVLYHKRLERGRFSVPDLTQSSGALKWPYLVLIVEGGCKVLRFWVKQKEKYLDICTFKTEKVINEQRE